MARAGITLLSLFDTGVAAARCLGRAGLEVEGYDCNPSMPGFKSRYCKAAPCPDPSDRPEELLSLLLERSDPALPRVLLPCGDDYVLFLSRHRGRLSGSYRFLLPDAETTERIVDKARQHELMKGLGVPAPHTVLVDSAESLRRAVDEMKGPSLFKPLRRRKWHRHFDNKGIEVAGREEAEETGMTILGKGLGAVMQEIIPGPCSGQIEVSCYVSSKGVFAGPLTIRKLRQYPIRNGTASFTESVRNDEVEDLTMSILRSLNWRGFANVEFKLDSRDGCFKFIEINPRVWQQVGHAESMGVNFPLLYYRDMMGEDMGATPTFPEHEKWLDPIRDAKASLRMIVDGELGFTQWLKSLRRVRSYGIWALDDPLPFLHSLGYGRSVLKLPGFIFRRLRKG